MRGLLPFGSTTDEFDDRGTFVPAHLPEPGGFLRGGAGDADGSLEPTVLTGDAHVRVHRWSREAFEARGVYDATFGYNLARLNLDTRHPDAGIRYARAGAELRAEFTPTTAFCPQAETLAVAAFRAWNDRGDGTDIPAPPDGIDRVEVRVAELHRDADAINDRLRALASDR
jgi:hypothetical protein